MSDEDLERRLSAYEYVICLCDHALFDKEKMAQYSRKFVDITGFEDQGIAAVLADPVNDAKATSESPTDTPRRPWPPAATTTNCLPPGRAR